MKFIHNSTKCLVGTSTATVFGIVRRRRRRKGVCGRLSPGSRWDPSIPTPTHQPHTSVLFPKPCNYPIYKYSLCQREGRLRQEELTLRWASPDLFPCQLPHFPSSFFFPTPHHPHRCLTAAEPMFDLHNSCPAAASWKGFPRGQG